MNKRVSSSIMLIIFSTVVFTIGCIDVDDAVEYEVVFIATWSEETHPDDFPPNPHFSGIIGASHNENVSFWQIGSLASPGIRSMAETGSKNPLTSEISSAILNNTALALISGNGIGTSPGQVSGTFIVSNDYPLVSLVTMIAPSPDWFVGVNSLNLFENGDFVDEKTVILYAFDAGTDSGMTYTSPNEITDPPELIYKIEGYPFLYNQELVPLGTFTFTRKN